ncbi:crotonase/enoyl-CoA hydratase family protein [Ferrimonas kyonanensis]|uniref:crotonase/enoyl-CoA hydratase family protein n=1 Tax=Ferrimonas kyonanensis TaxID=364763 RepID=UPI0003F5039B|nr:crotonase/enoyl-CoA hydratase family protein [Ferrimonas kyonanensis]
MDTTATAVHTARHGSIWVVTLNRPECRNAVDGPTATALQDAFIEFDSRAELKVAVLTGAGGQFCAGADLHAVDDPGRRNRIEPEGSGPLGPTRMQLSKPVIAAVEGYAVAGGLELALWCDLRVAADTAQFGVFCRRWGVPLIDGGSVRLPRLVGQGRALDMILTGRSVAAAEALAWGLVSRVVPEGQALEQALQLAASLTEFPQQCMKADRLSCLAQWSLPLERALEAEGRCAATVLQQEGLAGARRFRQGAGRHGTFEESDGSN